MASGTALADAQGHFLPSIPLAEKAGSLGHHQMGADGPICHKHLFTWQPESLVAWCWTAGVADGTTQQKCQLLCRLTLWGTSGSTTGHSWQHHKAQLAAPRCPDGAQDTTWLHWSSSLQQQIHLSSGRGRNLLQADMELAKASLRLPPLPALTPGQAAFVCSLSDFLALLLTHLVTFTLL